MEEKGIIVVEGRTELHVPFRTGQSQCRDVVFAYPPVSESVLFRKIEEELARRGLKKPSFSQTISLVHAAQFGKDKYSEEVNKLLKADWLFGFTSVPFQEEVLNNDLLAWLFGEDCLTELNGICRAQNAKLKFVQNQDKNVGRGLETYVPAIYLDSFNGQLYVDVSAHRELRRGSAFGIL